MAAKGGHAEDWREWPSRIAAGPFWLSAARGQREGARPKGSRGPCARLEAATKRLAEQEARANGEERPSASMIGKPQLGTANRAPLPRARVPPSAARKRDKAEGLAASPRARQSARGEVAQCLLTVTNSCLWGAGQVTPAQCQNRTPAPQKRFGVPDARACCRHHGFGPIPRDEADEYRRPGNLKPSW
jgi:hypothetical protein